MNLVKDTIQGEMCFCNVTLEEMRKIAHDESITEHGDRFYSNCNREGCDLLLSWSNRLRLSSPNTVISPFLAINDTDGALLACFGQEYKDRCCASFTIGHHSSSSQVYADRSEFYIVYDDEEATDVMVFIDWPIASPPAETGMGSELGRSLGAVEYVRTQSEGEPHGEDLWVIPLASILERWPDFTRLIQYQNSFYDYLWRQYDMNSDYYASKISELINPLQPAQVLAKYGCSFVTIEGVGEDCADICKSVGDVIWYDAQGLQHAEYLSALLASMSRPNTMRVRSICPGVIMIQPFQSGSRQPEDFDQSEDGSSDQPNNSGSSDG